MPDIIHNQELPVEEMTVEDMIGAVPGRFLYSGITMIAIVFITLLVLACFIKYPDKVSSVGTMTSDQPPIEITSNATGFIDTIYYKDGTAIKEKDRILRINNTTDEGHLSQLNNWMRRYESAKSNEVYWRTPFPQNLELGALQPNYAELELRYQELLTHMDTRFVQKQKKNLRQEIEEIKQLNSSLVREKFIYSKELDLAISDNNRSKELKEGGVISELEFEKNQSFLLQKQREFETMENGIIRNNININQLSLRINSIEEDRYKIIKNAKLSISELISRTHIEVQNWKQQYYVIAPIDGTLTLANGLVTKRNVKTQQVLGYINPDTSNEKYLSAFFPVSNLGKVEVGQRSIIKFDAFPYKEFGMVISEVMFISSLPITDKNGNTMYEVRLKLESKIMTDYNRELPFKPNMTATVDIITEEKTIMSRIFDQVLSLLVSNK